MDTNTEKYKENQQQSAERLRNKRKKYRDDKENGSLQSRNLYFIEYILNMYNINKSELCKKMGVSAGRITIWLLTDEITLGKAVHLFECLGLTLKPVFVAMDNKDSQIVKTTKRINIPTTDIMNNYVTGSMKSCIINNNGKLKPLMELFEKYALTPFKVSKLTGVTYNFLKRALENDDMKVSFMYRIAEKLNQQLVWEFTVNETGESSIIYRTNDISMENIVEAND